MKRENSLDPFAGNDAADSESCAASAALAGNHRSREHLNPLLVSFDDSNVNVDGVADVELGDFRPQLLLLEIL